MTADADLVDPAQCARLKAIADRLFDQLVAAANASGQLMQFAGLLAQPDGLAIIRDTCALRAIQESGEFEDLTDVLEADIAANLQRLGVNIAA